MSREILRTVIAIASFVKASALMDVFVPAVSGYIIFKVIPV